MPRLISTIVIVLMSLGVFAQDNEYLIVQLQGDKVCVDMDTCFQVRLLLSMTNKVLMMKDMDTDQVMITRIHLYERVDRYVNAYTTNDSLHVTIVVAISPPKVMVEYRFPGGHYVLAYRIANINNQPLIQYFNKPKRDDDDEDN
jgi:hypothetical protein